MVFRFLKVITSITGAQKQAGMPYLFANIGPSSYYYSPNATYVVT